jgi:hypothetical protein
MLEEWLKNIFNPEKFFDELYYLVDRKVIEFTEKILLEYGQKTPSNEGLVYWCGKKDQNYIRINSVIAPKTTSSEGRVSTSYEANAGFVRELSKNKIIQIGQVHSHPGKWVNHSNGDDKWAAFKVGGLLSIVVPSYGKVGMLPIRKCGIHRFTKDEFIRLSDQYIKKRFKIVKNTSQLLADLRK